MAPPSANVALQEFERCLNVALGIYGNVREECVYGWESINEGMGVAAAQKIVGLAFVGVIAGWEDFLENSFLRYMAGGRDSGGWGPSLRLGPCKSIAHAKQVLGCSTNASTASRRMYWSDYGWVENTAEIFFEAGKPFNFREPLVKLRIDTAFAIRNRVVHNSAQAKQRFKEAANKIIGEDPKSPLPRGFSPGKLLVHNGPTACFDEAWLKHRTIHWGDLFEAYVVFFEGMSGLIVAP